MATAESKLQKQILDWLNGIPFCVAWKIIRANEAGVPDILGCWHSKFFSVEVKVGNNDTTKLQDYQLSRVIGSDGTAIIAYSLDDVKNNILFIGGPHNVTI